MPNLLQVHLANCRKCVGRMVGKFIHNLTCQLNGSLYKIRNLIVEQSKTITSKFLDYLVFQIKTVYVTGIEANEIQLGQYSSR